ncbi:hypothetical protein [Puerhibacterium sp. TATVAM-FAB25]|uniref:hypothetical protein n=1 Tax=Puerhibacterium sp. TATVAM-FAB25 TaxID=3093699 RepID=UPI00397D84D7
MKNRPLAILLAVLAVVFLVLNFTVDAGTIFLILAVAAALGCVALLTVARAR